MQLEEIQQSIELRRNRIFLLMEEVRRLRIQQRVKVSMQPTSAQEQHQRSVQGQLSQISIARQSVWC